MARSRAGWWLVAAALIAWGARAAAPATDSARALTVQVQPGDTLWALADRADLPGADKRELVWVLKRLNGLDSAVIHPGQVLLVPVGGAAVRAAARDPQGFQRAALTPTPPPARPAIWLAARPAAART